MLRQVAAEFADPRVGLATCPYVAISGPRWAARLEALMMNTHFMAGVLTARMLEGMKFALGPSAVVRRGALDAIGGWKTLETYLAEDFMLGKLVAQSGRGVILSRVVVEHHIGDANWQESMEHRLRWCRSTRRSRPWGYSGEIFTNPLPLALLVTAVEPAWWPVLIFSVALRYVSCWLVVSWALRHPSARKDFWLVPVQDLMTLVAWVGGFFGNRITWRGRTYDLARDGRFSLVRGRSGPLT
jgi:ceramide glucosyltransferase